MEGPTADDCEKGGRPMSDSPMYAFRREIQDYLRSAEHLIAAASSSPPFTDEEVALVMYYVAEVQKILPVTARK